MPVKPDSFYQIEGTVKPNWFSVPETCRGFLSAVNEALHDYATVAAFCILPDTFLLLIKTHGEVECENFLKGIGLLQKNFQTFDEAGGILVMSTLLKNQLSKSLQGPHELKDHSVKEISTTGLGRSLADIHLEPVRKGLITSPQEWMFSSYNAYQSDKVTKIPREEILSMIGGKQAFLELHA